MITPSPEFPVIKVAMASRRRDKPLLTYGRRPSTTPEAPLSKKRKTTHEPSPLSTPDYTTASKEIRAVPTDEDKSSKHEPETEATSEEQPNQKEDAPKARKGTIMSFFKPLPPKLGEPEPGPNSDTPSPKPETERETSISSTPHPSGKQKRRTARLLRLRPAVPADASFEEDKENCAPLRTEENMISSHDPKAKDGLVSKSGAKPKSAPSIQTTLNISSRAAFSECRLCDTVWNPSHADDVKYHKRRHAAVLRRRQVSQSADSRESS